MRARRDPLIQGGNISADVSLGQKGALFVRRSIRIASQALSKIPDTCRPVLQINHQCSIRQVEKLGNRRPGRKCRGVEPSPLVDPLDHADSLAASGALHQPAIQRIGFACQIIGVVREPLDKIIGVAGLARPLSDAAGHAAQMRHIGIKCQLVLSQQRIFAEAVNGVRPLVTLTGTALTKSGKPAFWLGALTLAHQQRVDVKIATQDIAQCAPPGIKLGKVVVIIPASGDALADKHITALNLPLEPRCLVGEILIQHSGLRIACLSRYSIRGSRLP